MSGEDYFVVVVVYLKRMYSIISQAIYLFTRLSKLHVTVAILSKSLHRIYLWKH